jgi:hypothetical protein
LSKDEAYRWVSAAKAWDYYMSYANPSFGGDEGWLRAQEWLRGKICQGLIRAQFDGKEQTQLTMRLLFEFYDFKWPDQKGWVPADVLICRPDLQRVLVGDNTERKRRPGRPKGAGSFEDRDAPLVARMARHISGGGAASPSAAAKMVVGEKSIAGNSPDAKIRRLVRRYKARFGDDG